MKRPKIAIIWGDRVTGYMGRTPALGPAEWACESRYPKWSVELQRYAPRGFVWVNQWIQ